MLRESCTEKGDSTVQEAQGKMDMVVDKLQFRNLVDLWCKTQQFATPTIKMNSVK